EAVAARLDIGKDRNASIKERSHRGCRHRRRWEDHFIAGLDADSADCRDETRRRGIDANGKRSVEARGPSGLQFAYAWPTKKELSWASIKAGEHSRFRHPSHRFDLGRSDRTVRRERADDRGLSPKDRERLGHGRAILAVVDCSAGPSARKIAST